MCTKRNTDEKQGHARDDKRSSRPRDGPHKFHYISISFPSNIYRGFSPRRRPTEIQQNTVHRPVFVLITVDLSAYTSSLY
jgi:hypothetical protein